MGEKHKIRYYGLGKWLIALMLVLQVQWLYGQANSMKIQIHSVEHGEATETIDLYVYALDSLGKPFLDFHDETEDIRAWEIYDNEDSSLLEILYYGQIEEQDRFGEFKVYQVLTNSQDKLYREERRYRVEWLRNGRMIASSNHQIAAFGSDLNPLNLEPQKSFWDLLVLGGLIIVIVLFLLSEGVPLIRLLRFRSRHVKHYFEIQKAVEERNLHPITGKPLAPKDLVVAYCNRENCGVPYAIWKKRNYRCMHYPNNCNGNANIGIRQFFQQSGVFRQLNWLWFGTLGGLLAFLISYLFNKGLVGIDTQLQYASQGFSLGLGFMLALSWVEEIGQGRAISWGRILLRVFLGALLSALIFFVGYYLEAAIGIKWISTPLIWLVLSLGIGAVLSINSTIPLSRGVISAMIGGSISGVIYGLFIGVGDADIIRLFTFIVLGGVLGWGIMKVTKQLQTIELEVLSPAQRSGFIYSIDKWLQAGEKIIIGRDMKTCKVRVKWEDDFVLPHHAEMIMINEQVLIRPLADAEIWLDDQPLEKGKTVALKGGERIRLGRHSQTTFKYLQKT